MPSSCTIGPMERARIRSGLSKAQVAADLARDTRSVRRWELGQTPPPQAVMLRLADLYGCPVESLVAD